MNQLQDWYPWVTSTTAWWFEELLIRLWLMWTCWVCSHPARLTLRGSTPSWALSLGPLAETQLESYCRWIEWTLTWFGPRVCGSRKLNNQDFLNIPDLSWIPCCYSDHDRPKVLADIDLIEDTFWNLSIHIEFTAYDWRFDYIPHNVVLTTMIGCDAPWLSCDLTWPTTPLPWLSMTPPTPFEYE